MSRRAAQVSPATRLTHLALAALVGLVLLPMPARTATTPPATRRAAHPTRPPAKQILPVWPEGTEVVRFENVEGVLLIKVGLRGANGVDTSGVVALDTGAGFLALDRELAQRLGLSDSVAPHSSIHLAERALPRFSIGRFEMDQVSPVLIVDGRVVRRVTDRPVLGLLGQRPIGLRAIWIDFDTNTMALVPVTDRARHASDAADVRAFASEEISHRVESSRRSLPGLLGARARAIPFQLAGDGKIVVRAHLANPRLPELSGALNLIVDTGATKTVLFEDSLANLVRGSGEWPALRGLTVPTLVGNSDAHVALVPALELEADSGSVRQLGVDVVVLRTELSHALSSVTGLPIHGLLGSGFLQRYRVVIDYPARVLWLTARSARIAGRPYEYSHVGLQLERWDAALRVVAVAEGSPAARAGISVGDEIVSVNGLAVRGGQSGRVAPDVGRVTRLLEGPPGTRVILTVRHAGTVRTYRLIRRRLL